MLKYLNEECGWLRQCVAIDAGLAECRSVPRTRSAGLSALGFTFAAFHKFSLSSDMMLHNCQKDRYTT